MDMQTEKLEAIEMLLQVESQESLLRIMEFIKTESKSYPFSEDYKKVLEARLKEHELNPDEGISWEDLKDELEEVL